MKKSILILLIIILALIGLAVGCNNQQVTPAPPKQEAKIKVKRFTNESAAPGVSKQTVEKSRLEVQEFIKTYFETAFLDLQLGRTPNFIYKVFDFYSKGVPYSKNFDGSVLALGTMRKKFETIEGNSLEVPLLSVNFNKDKKPTISVVQFDFEANYKQQLAVANVKVFGWFALQKEGNEWKIFDFWAQQNVE